MASQKPLSEWTEAEKRAAVSRVFAKSVRPIAPSKAADNRIPPRRR